jgi:hypothetical protein
MRKFNSTARALTEAEMDAVAGGMGFFNEIIAKGMEAKGGGGGAPEAPNFGAYTGPKPTPKPCNHGCH